MTEPLDLIGIGGANVDVCGRSSVWQAGDSNPGSIHLSCGGVCRNICENAARLGLSAAMIAPIGPDNFGEYLRRSCREAGLGTEGLAVVPGCRTGVYLSAHGPDGDMGVAVNDMEIMERLTPEFLAPFEGLIAGAAALVLDANLPAPTLAALADAWGGKKPIFADPVSCAKALRLKPILSSISMLKPNRAELELLSGSRDLKTGVERLLEAGVGAVCVSLGKDGVLYADRTQTLRLRPKPRPQAVNATGAGDCLMAGLIRGVLRGAPMAEALAFAMTGASLTVCSEGTIRPDLSETLILRSVKEYME